MITTWRDGQIGPLTTVRASETIGVDSVDARDYLLVALAPLANESDQVIRPSAEDHRGGITCSVAPRHHKHNHGLSCDR